MIKVDQAERARISGVLRGLGWRLFDRLSTTDLVFIVEFIDAGELGLALEQMADVLSEDGRPISLSERIDMLALAERMKIGERVSRALNGCPDRIT